MQKLEKYKITVNCHVFVLLQNQLGVDAVLNESYLATTVENNPMDLVVNGTVPSVGVEETTSDVEEMPINRGETQIGLSITPITAADKGLTKKGLPRKRSSKTVNKPSKQQRQQEKHPLKNACDENKCKRKCLLKMLEE